MQFSIVEIDCDLFWDKLMDSSANSSIFSSSLYCNTFLNKYKRLGIQDGSQRIILSVIIPLENIHGLPHSEMYASIFFNLFEKQFTRKSSENSAVYNALTFLIEYLSKKHKGMRFSLHHEIKDLRAINDFNYSNSNKIQVNLRHTSILDIERGWQEICSKYISKTRLYEARRLSKKYKFTKINEISKEDVLLLYSYDKKITIQSPLVCLAYDVINSLLKDNNASVIKFSQNSQTLAINVFLYFKNTAFYHSSYISTESSLELGSSAMMTQIETAHIRKLKAVDFVGVNSPNRGFFKASFGGKIVNYYEILFL